MSNDETKKEEVFIGARVLGEDGVKLVLPTYEILKSQINQMKSAANNIGNGNNDFSKAMKYNREHNNTIAIFGSRGTGKTSALYTLMNDLEKENTEKSRKNIVLPIIEPDNFGDNTKIMGSIIGLIKNEVDILLNEIKGDSKKSEPYFKNCIYIENNSLKQKMDELLEYHMYSDTEYRNIITHNYTDTATHIKKSSHLLIPDINLKQKFWDVIDEIVKHKSKDEDKSTIFIFIDDIDLKTTKCKELIEAIMQFSSHPNVITILSGDYEILKEGMMLSLIGDENLSEKGLDANFILKKSIEPKIELLNLDKTKINIENSKVNTININEIIENGFTIKDRKLNLAENYLKKLIPPSRRHHVVNWNIDNIPEFSFGETKLKDILYAFYNNEDNIFGYKDKDSNICSTKYPYIIFDTTPRGLINVYYSLSRIVNNDNKNFFDIKFLIDTIIDSSPDILEKKDEFSEFINWGSHFKSTQINYDGLIISENETRSLKEYLSYFIIAEMLLYYEKNISENGIYYSKNDYDLAKKNILTSLYYNASIESLCKGDTEYKIYNEIKRMNYLENILYNIAITFALNLEFMDSLRFLSMLLETEFMDKYGYDSYSKDPEINDKKNNNFFRCVYEFISINEEHKKEILKNMKNLENIGINEKDTDVTEIYNFFYFLKSIADVSKERGLIRLKYKDIYDCKSTYDKLMPIARENNDITIRERLMYKSLIEIIMFNTISIIDKDKDIGSKNLEKFKNEYSLRPSNIKRLNTIKKFIENENNVNEDNKQQFIINLRSEVSEEFLKLIRLESKYYFKINSKYINFEENEFYESLESFLNGNDGKSMTVYYQCKINIREKIVDPKNWIELILKSITALDINQKLNECIHEDNGLITFFNENENLKKYLKNDKITNLFKDDILIKDLIDESVLENYLLKNDILRNGLIKKKTLSLGSIKDKLLKAETEINSLLRHDLSIEINSKLKDNNMSIIDMINKMNLIVNSTQLEVELNFMDLIKESEVFSDIYFLIKPLAENDRLKYGQTEAQKFIKEIEENVSINLDDPDIKQYIPLIYYIGKLNEFINPNLKSDEEFEEIKRKMKKILDDVSEESKLETIKTMKEFGLGEYGDED